MSRIELHAYDYDEDAPFLDVDERPDEPIPATDSAPSRPPRRPLPWQVQSPLTIVILAAIAKFTLVASGMMILMPMYRLIEDAFCHRYYEDDSPGLIEEMECKVDEVQSPLAFMMGWSGLLNAIINLIVAYPYGMLSDRIGRKPTALLAYSGLAISFIMSPLMLGVGKTALRANPYLLLTGSLFGLIGGGVPVFLSTLYSIAADVSAEEDKASSFLYLTLGSTCGGLVGPLLSGLLMKRWGPWVPISICLCTIPFMFCILLVIPETLTVSVKTQSNKNQPHLVAIWSHMKHGISDLFSSLKMLKNTSILLCLTPYLLTNVRFSAQTSTLPQYISKHFGWTIAETSVLLSPLHLIHIIVLASLPMLSKLLMSRFGFSTFHKDAFLARTSLFILAFAAFIQGCSTSIGLFLFALFIGAFGAAEAPLTRATVSHYVDPTYTARLYALAGMVEVLGTFVGPPVLAWCFDRGLKKGGVLTGLPWFYIAALSALAGTAMRFVRTPRRRWGEDDILDDDDEGGTLPSNPIHLN